MSTNEQIAYLETMPLVLALWWWIENVTVDDPSRNETFFYLRQRVRAYEWSLS